MLILWIMGRKTRGKVKKNIAVATTQKENSKYFWLDASIPIVWSSGTDGYRITETNIILIDNCNLSEAVKTKWKMTSFVMIELPTRRSKQLKPGCAVSLANTSVWRLGELNYKSSECRKDQLSIFKITTVTYMTLKCPSAETLHFPSCSESWVCQYSPGKWEWKEQNNPHTLTLKNKQTKARKIVFTFFISTGVKGSIKFIWAQEIHWTCCGNAVKWTRRRNEAS